MTQRMYNHVSTEALEKLYARTNDPIVEREIHTRRTKANMQHVMELKRAEKLSTGSLFNMA